MNFFKKVFRKNIEEEINFTKSQKNPKGFEKELLELKEKLSDFLQTAKVSAGEIVKKENYKILKSATGLYRLEGKEKTGLEYSIIISTMNHLQLNQEKKITGLIQVSEAELNRAIRLEHSSLKSFLSKFSNLQLTEKSLELIEEKNKFSWKEILLWDKFYKELLFLKLKPNTISLLLITESENFKTIFLENTTKKQKKIISDELFFLNQGVNSSEMNPNTKNFNLYNFEEAKIELLKKILEIKKMILNAED